MKKLLLSTLSILLINTYNTSFGQTAGNLDPSFGTGGKVVTSVSTEDKSYGVEIQSDGKIVVAGYSTSGITGKDFTCIRYNPDGTLDTSFGTGGIATTDVQLGSEDVAYDLAIQTDGKIVLAGYSDDGTDKNAAMVRYNTDGSIDNTFGTSGVVVTDFDSSQQDEIKVVKIHLLTGNIIVGGSSALSSTVSKPVVARYLSDGTLDTSFDSNGIRLLWVTNLDYQYQFSVEDLVVQSNGKISFVGWRDFVNLSWDSDYWAGRINSDGTMDLTFSTDGVNIHNNAFNGHDRIHSMLLEPNGDIFAAGGSYISSLYYSQSLFKINANGSFISFGINAEYNASHNDIAYSLNKDSNGKFIMAGSTGLISTRSFAITRANSNMTFDNSFGGTGKVTTTFDSNSLNECFDAAVQTDDKIVAVGYTGNDFAIARYLGVDQPDLDNFQLQSPLNSSSSQNYASLNFNWSDAFGATSYEMEIDTDAAFNVSPQTYTVTSSTETLNNLLPNTQYFWRVKASDGTNWGQYSTTWSFTTNTLENFNLISPAHNSIDQAYINLAFDWSDAVGASSYEFELDTDQTFSNPTTNTSSNSNYTATTLLEDTEYFWRVRASDGNTWGQWSSIWKFTTDLDDASVEIIDASNIQVYPNPTSGDLKLVLGETYKDVNVHLLNSMGQVVGIKSFGDTQEINWEINESSGFYFVEILTENKVLARIQIIKE